MKTAFLIASSVLLMGQANPIESSVPANEIERHLLVSQSPTCNTNGLTIVGGRVQSARYYGAMNGFAESSRTTGGLGRRYFEVTTSRDDASAPPGSLREALRKTAMAGGGWIGFSPALKGKKIELAKPLRLTSNITLDGGCSAPTIEAQRKGSLIYLRTVENIVVSRLNLQHRGLQPGDTDKGDCVTVSHGSDRVWIAFNTMRHCADGLVDITQNGASGQTRATVSYNLFTDHDKAMLIAGDPGGSPTNPSIKATIYRNMFLRTGQRHPRVSGSAYAHVVENIVAFQPYQRPDQNLGGAYGSLATDGGQMMVERTIYNPLTRGKRFRLIDNETPSLYRLPYVIANKLNSENAGTALSKVAATAGSKGWENLGSN